MVITALALGVWLSACSPPQAPALPAPSPTQVDSAALAEAPTAAPPEASSPTLELPAIAAPTARAGLEATDPTTVDLAAGTPTLLEFFAFW
ncbi:MAG: hypothetical protein A2Y93_09435 [Chloroflexi bacterium RBG_13_68_17]|nr:MAG: hypothetical protein A2Y93_09435 [Chloroflexi bacterium RBG_13_68_17]